MLVGDHGQAVAELAQICKPGSRLVLPYWDTNGSVRGFFVVNGKHSGAAPRPMSPMAWGDPDRISKVLGDSFGRKFEAAGSCFRFPNAEAV